jgi:putative nicotinate phosphoribosyltransferase
MVSPSLLTDHYELTMLSSFVGDGLVDKPAVFEAFARRLPAGRRYGLLAGAGRLLDMIERFTFDADEVAWLRERGVITEEGAAYLRDFRFSGDIDGIPEGDLWFPGTPVLTVTGTLGECLVLETLVLSVLNHDSAIASAAARMVTAAQGRPLIEMGSRRVHEDAAIAAARAAWIAGFDSTSNLAAGRIHGVPTVGTAAHAFTLAHESEPAAFASQVGSWGVGTTLLVDTYDYDTGIRNAVEAARAVGASGPGAIRLDSGDLAEEAHKARRLLDELGATETRIVATSDLDEYVLTALQDAPIDGYGVGTRVATGSGHPTAGMVYKLVAIDDDGVMRPVAKKAESKGSSGGRKSVWRVHDSGGRLLREAHTLDPTPPRLPEGEARPAQVPLVRAGRVVDGSTLDDVRARARQAIASLPPAAHDVSDGPSAIVPVVIVPTAPDPSQEA